MLKRCRPSAAVCFLAAGAVVLAACGSDSKSTAISGASSSPADTAPAVVHVTARDFTYDVPESIPSGVVELQLENQGQQPHDFQLVAIDGNHSLDEIKG